MVMIPAETIHMIEREADDRAAARMGERSEAERILLDCATTYYVASGLVPIDGQDGYGPLRDARLFIEQYGSNGAKAALAGWRRRRDGS